MFVVTYARYSSDNQRETSIEDQFRLSDARAERECWPKPIRFSDSEISAGTPTLLRTGARALMEAIRAGGVKILLIESLDRCWRDIVDQERTIREIESRGVRIIGYADGYDSDREGRELQRVILGGLNQEYLRALAKKTHRGLSGQIERGYHAGGMSYGYKSEVAELNAKGEPVGYRLAINEEQAEWVKWIFERYVDGWSARRIAHELNHRRVPSTRGGTWAVSALYGSAQKGTGILNNILYTGEYVWNRSRWVKDPDTGKRKRIERPQREWKRTHRPDLKILTDEIWQAAQARRNAPGIQCGGSGKGQRPLTLLGGLMSCGRCGGAVVAIDKYRYGCAAHHDRGDTVCTGIAVRRDTTEMRLLSTLRDDLLSPASIAAIQSEVARQMQASRRTVDDSKARLAALDSEIRHLTDAVAACGLSEALRARLEAAEAARRQIVAETRPKPATLALDNVAARYRRLLADLPGTLKRRPEAAREALRSILGGIRLVPDGNEVWAEITARADQLLVAAYGCGSGGRI